MNSYLALFYFTVKGIDTKSYRKPFTAYSIQKDGSLSDEIKARRYQQKIEDSKDNILHQVDSDCENYNIQKGWIIQKWESKEMDWIVGQGEVRARFSCTKDQEDRTCHRKGVYPYCNSLGCSSYGGKCCRQFCSVF